MHPRNSNHKYLREKKNRISKKKQLKVKNKMSKTNLLWFPNATIFYFRNRTGFIPHIYPMMAIGQANIPVNSGLKPEGGGPAELVNL